MTPKDNKKDKQKEITADPKVQNNTVGRTTVTLTDDSENFVDPSKRIGPIVRTYGSETKPPTPVHLRVPGPVFVKHDVRGNAYVISKKNEKLFDSISMGAPEGPMPGAIAEAGATLKQVFKPGTCRHASHALDIMKPARMITAAAKINSKANEIGPATPGAAHAGISKPPSGKHVPPKKQPKFFNNNDVKDGKPVAYERCVQEIENAVRERVVRKIEDADAASSTSKSGQKRDVVMKVREVGVRVHREITIALEDDMQGDTTQGNDKTE